MLMVPKILLKIASAYFDGDFFSGKILYSVCRNFKDWLILSLIDEFNEPFETRFEKKAVLCNTIGALLVMLINLIFQNKGKIQYTN